MNNQLIQPFFPVTGRWLALACLLAACAVSRGQEIIFQDGFEFIPPPLDFPMPTAAVQEPVLDGLDGPAAHVYRMDGQLVMNTGEFRLDRTDLAVPGRGGLSFTLQRRYRSQLQYDGPLGHGWDFTYNERLSVQPDGDVIRANGRGHVDTWTSVGGGEFLNPAGFFGTLTVENDGSYVLREANGLKRFFSSHGFLQKYEDRSGNSMTFEYDAGNNLVAVRDVFGRAYVLEYDVVAGRSRITRVSDFSGRTVVYGYDGNGDLVSVRTPVVAGTSTGNDFPQGRVESYTYLSGQADSALDHNLATITYPVEVALAGPPAVQVSYGDTGFPLDRVTAVTVGGTNAASGVNAGGTATLSWESLNQAEPLGQPMLERSLVTLTERNGNQQKWYINENLHVFRHVYVLQGLRPDLEFGAYWETVYTFDADGQLTERRNHEGNRIAYTYDSAGPRAAQRNVLEVRRIADLVRGGGEDLVTTYSYEPVFNQLRSKTDPRGNASGFVPPIGAASALRYTTQYFYDYQEHNLPIPDAVRYGINLAVIPRNLGDLNDDGVTDQVAGNPVRIEQPTVTLVPGSNEASRLGGTAQPIISTFQWNDRGQKTASIDQEGNRTAYAYYPENDPDGDGSAIPGSALPRGYLQTSTVDAAPASSRRSAPGAPAELESHYRYDAIGNIVATRNPRGIETHYEVNALRETLVETRGGDIAEAVASGQLITGESRFQYRSRFFFDANGRLVTNETENRAEVSVTEGVGDWVEQTYVYDILDNVVQQTLEVDDVTTTTTQYEYDANELLVLLTRPEGNQTSYQYDERNLPFRTHRGFGSQEVSITQVDYDGNANVVRTFDAEDNDGEPGPEATRYAYDGFDRRIQVIDALGNEQQVTYDVASNQVRIEILGHPANQPSAGNVLLADTRFHLDELNRAYRSDRNLFLASGFDLLRAEDLRDENSDGLVTDVAEYDALSRLTFKTEDDGDTYQFVYDGVSRVIERIDPVGNRQLSEYDRNSNLLEWASVEVAPGISVPDETFTTRYVYDQLDRLVRTTDNDGRTRRMDYDSRDNLARESDAVGPMLNPDPLGLFSGAVNAEGNTRSFAYDGRDLRVRVDRQLRQGGLGGNPLDTSNPSNPDGVVSLIYEYDGNARLSRIIDDNGNATAYSYDSLDRRVGQTNADTTEYVYSYDRDSNLVSVTDPNLNMINNTYDGINRLVQRDIVRGPGVTGTTQELYGYDGMNRQTFSSDNNGPSGGAHTVDRAWDSLSRLLEENQDLEPVSHVYAGDGRRQVLNYPTERTIEFNHDALNRVIEIVEPNPVKTLWASTVKTSVVIDAIQWMGPDPYHCSCECDCPCIDGRLLLQEFGNGTAASFLNDARDAVIGYSAVREPVGIRHLFEAAPFVDRSYEWNRAYRMTAETHLDLPGQPANLYTLDSSYRVQSATFEAEASPEAFQQTNDYELDGAGNRTLVGFTQDFGAGQRAGAAPGVKGAVVQFDAVYTGNEMNEYISIDGASRSHDDNGNLTEANGQTYVYDYRNRLVEVRRSSDQALRARYEYDADGRRVQRTLFMLGTVNPPEEEVRYFYDGWEVIEEWGDDTDYGLNGPRATYVNGLSIDRPVQLQTSDSWPAGAGTFYYHHDIRGNVVALTDEAGTVVERNRYSDYDLLSQSVGVDNPYLFQSRRLDPETGFYFFRNRHYDPLTGRFIQRDPVWDAANVGNQYAFEANNPVVGMDPLGTRQPINDPMGAPMILGGGPEPMTGGPPANSTTVWSPQHGNVTVIIDERLWEQTHPFTPGDPDSEGVNPAFRLAIIARAQLIGEGLPSDSVAMILYRMMQLDPEVARMANAGSMGPGYFIIDLWNLLNGRDFQGDFMAGGGGKLSNSSLNKDLQKHLHKTVKTFCVPPMQEIVDEAREREKQRKTEGTSPRPTAEPPPSPPDPPRDLPQPRHGNGMSWR
ncbi:MAG: RHS repeat-associated core domain-containing protein [Xanthomonadales bacterium]|nr:RHS repeat-associated core domain-containing protein [Xanthomonadales bacterium]